MVRRTITKLSTAQRALWRGLAIFDSRR